ncbi:glycosyltransferase family 2 protein [bacterium]|nr:MAG: glycosyltransferase family 2 protein [bacterium]
MGDTVKRLGVVVLNWNGRDHLVSCLDSLAACDHPDHFVLVVDNGSHDGSVEMVRAREGVQLLALDQNLRFSGGNNAGAARAIELGAEVLLILNNDTLVEPDALAALATQMDAGHFDLAGPRIVYADRPERIWYGGGIFRPRLGHVAHRAIRRSAGDGADPAGATDWVSGCALAIRADLWQELGGLDEAYYIYSEDVDLCMRARARGASIGYCPAATIRHDVSATVGGDSSAFKAYHRTRARRQLMRRYGQGPLWPVGLLVEDLAWAAMKMLQGYFAAAGAVLRAVTEPASAAPRFPAEDLVED